VLVDGGWTQALDGQINIIIVEPGNGSEPTVCPVRPPGPAEREIAVSGDTTWLLVGLHRLPE
jgi:hypothetical protein